MQDKWGVLVGCDRNQEWLLSWWWNNIQRVGNYSVTFADFGMSDQARVWCQKRGELLSLHAASKPEPLCQKLVEESGTWLDDAYLTSRPAWFKKPEAMQNSPYARTLWLDLDCEVLTPLEPLFDTDLEGASIGLVREAERHQKFSEILYNSGVVLYESSSLLIRLWAEQAKSRTSQFRGDQELLSHIIQEQGFRIKELPSIYNWNIFDGILLDACIIHWLGSRGKAFIRQEHGVRAFLSKRQFS